MVALRDFLGRARLEVCGCPKNRVINRIAYPKLNLLGYISCYVDDSVCIPPLIIIPRHNLAHIP